MNPKQRVRWIDISKAICIYFVILGHALSYTNANEYAFRSFIFIFDLQLFFYVSGYLYRIKENEKSIISYLVSNIKSLIIPYIFLNIIAVCLFIPSIIHQVNSSLYYFFIGHGYAPAGPAWFLLCLFWIKIQMFWVSRLDDRIQLLIAFIYALFAYYFPWHLYWDIDASFMAMPIFIIGYLTKKHFSELINKPYSLWLLCGLFLITLFATFYLSLIQHIESMFSRIFGTYGVLFYIGALTGIVMIVSLCKLLDGVFPDMGGGNKVVSVLSSGSIIIMGLHLVFYRYTLAILNKFSILTKSELNIPFKVIICLIVLAEMYFPIIILQKYCSQFLGGRKS